MNDINRKNIEIFQNAPVPKAVLTNIIPSIVSMIMVLIYNLADTFFIGQTKNAFMVAAVSLATPAFLLFYGSRSALRDWRNLPDLPEAGRRRRRGCQKDIFFLFLGRRRRGRVVGFFAIQIGIDPVARIVGATPDTVAYVKQYLSIVSFGIPFLIISNSFSNIIRAEGKANLSMMGMIIGNLVNIILDPIMILGFGWDVAGAAVATVLGNMAAALFYIAHFVLKRSILSIRIRDYRAGGGIAKGVLAIGIPASLNGILMSVSHVTINNFINGYGDMAVAGLGVAMKVNMIAVMLLIGVGTGIQPVLGFCFGAGNRKRFNAVLKFSLMFSVALSLVMTAVCYFGASPMVSAFLQDPDAYAYGMQFARILILSGPILGILFVLVNTLQAMGAAIPSLILSVSRQGLIYIPVLFLFSHIFDSAAMLVASQPVTDYMATFIAFVLYTVVYRRYFAGKNSQAQSEGTLNEIRTLG